MAKIGVIADDLTGANDTGVQFSKQGLKTIVLTHSEYIKTLSNNVDVVVLDTESRMLSRNSAYEKAKDAALKLIEADIHIIYKKIDSTLKGNIGAELDGVMDAIGTKTVIVAPAFPANKRVTVGGYQLVDQIPLAKTEAAQDPMTPVKESHVPTLIASQSKRKVDHVSLTAVMNPFTLKDALTKCIQKDVEIIVVDSMTQNDLKRIAYAINDLGLHKLSCGPAGLAEEIPGAFGLISGKPVIAISGSISEITMRQMANAESSGSIMVLLNVSNILGNNKDNEIKRVIANTKQHIQSGYDVIISSAKSKNDVLEDIRKSESIGISSVELSNLVGSVLGEIACETVKIPNIAGLFITGGTTAIRALELIGSLGIEVDDEVSPGIPSAVIVGGKNAGLRIVTKAGAFGNDEAITNSIRHLKMKSGR